MSSTGSHGSPVTTASSTTAPEGGGRRARLRPRPLALRSHLHDPFRVAAVLTLLATVAGPPQHLRTPVMAVALVGLFLPQYVLRARSYWLVLLVVSAASQAMRPWLALDNHHFLELYWLTAIVVTRYTSEPDAALQRVARLLVGFAFLFAAGWKLLSPDFLSGAFFEVVVVTEPRVAELVSALGLVAPDATDAVLAGMHAWWEPGAALQGFEIPVDPAVRSASVVLAWGTVVIEVAIAMVHLAPLRGRWRYLRDGTLLAFVALTYVPVPVIGFGWMLAILGVMQSDLPVRVRTTAYLVAFGLLTLIGRRGWVLDLLGA